MVQALAFLKIRLWRPWPLWMAVLFALPGFVASSPARAGYDICNETSYVLEAALGRTAQSGISTQGWLQILPGACRKVVKEKLDLKPLYLFARTPKLYDQVLKKFSGGQRLCVSSGDFTIANAATCADPAHSYENFIEITPRKDNWQTSLTEERTYKGKGAALAGIQRLLAMTGYDVGDIDGVAGAMTNRVLDDFMAKGGLQYADRTSPEVIRALIAAVRKRQTKSGLQICNETRHLVWTTIGLHQGENIVTRGWYQVLAGECIRPVRKPLDGQVLYSFGEAVDKDGPVVAKGNIPLIWDGATELCTSDKRFTIETQGNCAGRGFKITKFRKIDLGGAKSWTIRYTEPQ